MIKLVVFDWDGTLMDSEARIVASMRNAFAMHGQMPPARAAVRDLIGLDLRAAITLLDPTLVPSAIAAITDSYRQAYAAAVVVPSPLFDGAETTLEALSRQGIVMAVSRRGLDRALAETGLAHFFASSRCADETVPKPDPAMLHEILSELEIDADDALMLGDTEFDLNMAAAAAVKSAGVSYGAHSTARLLRWNPVIVIDALTELPDHIRQLNFERHLQAGVGQHG